MTQSSDFVNRPLVVFPIPALRRRRISHEGLLLIVPIPSASKTSAKTAVHGTAESYGVDTPFQVPIL
jgi:hypothetical protein